MVALLCSLMYLSSNLTVTTMKFTLTAQCRLCTLLVLFALLVVGCTPGGPRPAAQTAPSQPPSYIRLEPLLPGAALTTEPTPASLDVAVDPQKPYVTTKLFLNGPVQAASDRANIYWVAPGQPISATYRFDNAMTVTRKLTFLCMVDYQQVPCRPNEPMVAAEVPSGKRAFIPFALPGLSPGMRNLTVAAVSYLPAPLDIVTNPDALAELVFRSPEFFWAMAVTVYAGLATPPAVNWQPIQLIPLVGIVEGNLSITPSPTSTVRAATGIPLPNLTPGANSTGRLIQLKPGERLQLYLIAGFSERAFTLQAIKQLNLDRPTNELPFVLTAFLDTQQISLSGVGGPTPLFSKIPLGKYGVIPLTVVAPNVPGIHSVSVMYQESPYLPQGEFVPQPDGGMVYKYLADLNRMETSNRVTFEVVP